MQKYKTFICDCCGCCCKNISLSPIYLKFDRGDGVCKYFDDETSLCSIYSNRPIEGNVDVVYKRYFIKKMSKKLYYEMNYRACEKLKRISGENHV